MKKENIEKELKCKWKRVKINGDDIALVFGKSDRNGYKQYENDGIVITDNKLYFQQAKQGSKNVKKKSFEIGAPVIVELYGKDGGYIKYDTKIGSTKWVEKKPWKDFYTKIPTRCENIEAVVV